MLRTSEELERRAKRIWPNLYHKWLSDRVYWSPSYEDFANVVAAQDVRDLPFREKYCECEEFARLLHSSVSRHLIDEANVQLAAGLDLPDRLAYSWAFGRAKGMNFPQVAKGKSHDLIVVDLEEGIRLLEPQTYQIWEPGISKTRGDENFVYYIDM